MNNLISQANLGKITKPSAISNFSPDTLPGKIVNLIVQGLLIGAGIYALINIITAGYAFISSEGDPKKVAAAWTKIWQTLFGLAIAGGAFVLVSLIGRLLFGTSVDLLKPVLPTL